MNHDNESHLDRLNPLISSSMPNDSAVTLTATVDRRLVDSDLPSERVIEWTLEAAAVVTDRRPPLHLALVIDRSGSMEGEKIRRARLAACRLIDRLEERDRVCLVAFNEDVLLLSPNVAITPATREDLKARVNRLDASGMTNLSGGYFKGAMEVAETMNPDGIHRILLLSDGQANRGITDPEELCQHARELRNREVTLSTFGIGQDFNEHLLEGMSNAGGGHFFYIEDPEQIPAILQQELGELLTVVAKEVVFHLTAPKGARVTFLGDLPVERSGSRFLLPFGALASRERRSFYTTALVAPGKPGGETTFRGSITYNRPDGERLTVDAAVTLSFAESAAVEAAPRDAALLSRADGVRLAESANRALQLERSGKREAAIDMMRCAFAMSPLASEKDRQRHDTLLDEMTKNDHLSESVRKQQHNLNYQRRTSRE